MYYIDCMKNILFLADFTKDNSIHYAETGFTSKNIGQTHQHDFYEILFILSGEITHSLPGHISLLKKYDIQFIRPNDQHNLIPTGQRECHIINIAFSPRHMDRRLLDLMQYNTKDNLPFEPLSTSSFFFSTLIQSAMQIKEFYHVKSRENHLYHLLHGFMLEYSQKLNSCASKAPLWLQDVCGQMHYDENYIEGLTAFVTLSHRTQEHLTRQMKKYYQLTPTAFINDLRLKHAAGLLTDSRKDILTIMHDSGFNNSAYFSRKFKAKYQCTPSEYRNFNINILFHPKR